jgi:hypothetical protein
MTSHEKIAKAAYLAGVGQAIKEANMLSLNGLANAWQNRDKQQTPATPQSTLQKMYDTAGQVSGLAGNVNDQMGAVPLPKELKNYMLRGTSTKHTYSDRDLDEGMTRSNAGRRIEKYAPALFDSSLRTLRKTFLPPALQGDASLTSFDDLSTNIANNAYGMFGDVFGVRGGVSD